MSFFVNVFFMCASFVAGTVVSAFYLFGIKGLVEKDNFPLVSSLTVAMSATIALFTALVTLHNHNKRVREKNTIDAIAEERGAVGPEFMFISEFIEQNSHDTDKALRYLARNNIHIDEMPVIMKKLNEIEHLCEGVFKNIYDHDLLKNTRGSSIIRLWEKLGPYIHERRKIQQEKLKDSGFLSKEKCHVAYYYMEKYHDRLVKQDKCRFTMTMYLLSPLILILPFLPMIMAFFRW